MEIYQARKFAPPAEIKSLCTRNLGRSLFEISLTYALLAAALFAAARVGNPLWRIGIFVFISTRQYALLILMHDGLHGCLSNSRAVNDVIARFVLAYPVGSLFTVGREKHLQHHQFLGEAGDPDSSLYQAEIPTKKSLVSYFFFGLIWNQLKYSFSKKSKTTPGPGTPPPSRIALPSLLTMVFFQCVLLGGLWYFSGRWYFYFLYWLSPILTLVIFWDKFRIFCEHSVPRRQQEKTRAALRTFASSPLENFFFAPFDMNFHAEHHLFPAVPHWNLPRLRKMLSRAIPAEKSNIQYAPTYLGYFRHYWEDLG